MTTERPEGVGKKSITSNNINAVSKEMFKAVVSPKIILERGIVQAFEYEGYKEMNTDINDKECQIQQNGIDLRLADAVEAIGCTKFSLYKVVDERCFYHPLSLYDNTFTFLPGKMYPIDFMEYIEVPDDMCAHITMRSSINRYSGTIFSGIWDSGFCGRLGGVFRPNIHTTIEVGCRVAQIVFFYADAYRAYEGQYQNQQSNKENE